jgi:hypothetical protein
MIEFCVIQLAPRTTCSIPHKVQWAGNGYLQPCVKWNNRWNVGGTKSDHANLPPSLTNFSIAFLDVMIRLCVLSIGRERMAWKRLLDDTSPWLHGPLHVIQLRRRSLAPRSQSTISSHASPERKRKRKAVRSEGQLDGCLDTTKETNSRNEEND